MLSDYISCPENISSFIHFRMAMPFAVVWYVCYRLLHGSGVAVHTYIYNHKQ